LTDAHNSASFNGTNVLTGSSQGIMNFMLAFEASATGGAISTTGFTPQAYSGGATVATTAQQPATRSILAGTRGLLTQGAYNQPRSTPR
jgi:hypothetical protein